MSGKPAERVGDLASFQKCSGTLVRFSLLTCALQLALAQLNDGRPLV
jgi:hypothetical protein